MKPAGKSGLVASDDEAAAVKRHHDEWAVGETILPT